MGMTNCEIIRYTQSAAKTNGLCVYRREWGAAESTWHFIHTGLRQTNSTTNCLLPALCGIYAHSCDCMVIKECEWNWKRAISVLHSIYVHPRWRHLNWRTIGLIDRSLQLMNLSLMLRLFLLLSFVSWLGHCVVVGPYSHQLEPEPPP